MGSFFGGSPSMPSPPPVDTSAQTQVDEEAKRKKQQIAAQQRARLYGGNRQLLSTDRPDAELGVTGGPQPAANATLGSGV